MKLMSKIDRISSWILMACFFIYIISGFDIQERFLFPKTTSFIHLQYLFVPTIIVFAFHTSYSIYIKWKRKRSWLGIGRYVMVLYISINIFLIFYFFLK